MDEETYEDVSWAAEKVRERLYELYKYLCELDFDDNTWDDIQSLFDEVDVAINSLEQEIYYSANINKLY